MNLKELKEIIELLRSSEVTEIEVEQSGVRYRVRKDSHSAPAQIIVSTTSLPPPAPAATSLPEAAGAQRAPDQAGIDAHVVRSPIVGTFFRAPSPDAEPYVQVGDVVKKGQVLCIVEAMKLMNEIESEIDGKILEIVVNDAQPVEFGEPLLKIAPLKGV